MKVARVFFQLVLAALVVFLAACHFNYPRIWWQEVLCGYSVVWLPFVVVAVGWSLYRLYRERSFSLLPLITAVVGVGLIGHIVNLMWPYVSYSKKIALTREESIEVGVFHPHVGDSAEEVARFRQKMADYRPDLLVLHDTSPTRVDSLGLTEKFPFTLRATNTPRGALHLFSRFPLTDESRTDLGIATLPALYAKVQLDEEVVMEFGALALSPITSTESFELSRVTARRLASIMRNSITPRMVVGDFFLTPLAQTVSMYNRQARMRSIFYDEGIESFARIQSVTSLGRNVNAFVSAGIDVRGTIVDADLHPSRRSVFTVIKVPRATIVPR